MVRGVAESGFSLRGRWLGTSIVSPRPGNLRMTLEAVVKSIWPPPSVPCPSGHDNSSATFDRFQVAKLYLLPGSAESAHI